jgi:hypothetical protein
MNRSNNQGDHELDRATSRRLGQLRTTPVEAGRLEQLIRAQIPDVAQDDAADERMQSRWSIRWWLRPGRAVAAAAILLVAVTILVLTNLSGEAMASTTQMAQMHDDLVSGRVPVMEVASIDEASRMLAGKSASLPRFGEGTATQPEAHVMACCMKSVQNKRVACVLMKSDGVPVTMAVADAKDVRSPKSRVVRRGASDYHVETVGVLNMVMTERDGRWVCMIAEMPADRLISLASKLEF